MGIVGELWSIVFWTIFYLVAYLSVYGVLYCVFSYSN